MKTSQDGYGCGCGSSTAETTDSQSRAGVAASAVGAEAGEEKRSARLIDSKVTLLIAAGAAIAANCEACLTKIVGDLKEACVRSDDIRQAIQIGQFVKDKPAGMMKELADRLAGTHLAGTELASEACPLDHGEDAIRQAVRARYAAIAQKGETGCGCAPGGTVADALPVLSRAIGYSEEELAAAPEGANMGLGCGNPQAIAVLQPGETVLDLGSGGGFDCFLAAKQVGEKGRVIGVDMTPEMITKARQSAEKAGYKNVEFRLGEIEALPVADASVDVILSNCVVNLSPDKARVYREAYRLLKPGGRLAISDIVATAEMPEAMRTNLAMIAGCVAGAARIEDLQRMLTEAGFEKIQIRPKESSRDLIRQWLPESGFEDYIVSASIEVVKPAA